MFLASSSSSWLPRLVASHLSSGHTLAVPAPSYPASLAPTAPGPSSEDPCGYTGPTWIVQALSPVQDSRPGDICELLFATKGSALWVLGSGMSIREGAPSFSLLHLPSPPFWGLGPGPTCMLPHLCAPLGVSLKTYLVMSYPPASSPTGASWGLGWMGCSSSGLPGSAVVR